MDFEHNIRSGFDSNVNVKMDQNPEELLNVYETVISSNPDSYQEFIREVQYEMQKVSGLSNSCTVECDVDAMALVELSRQHLGDEGLEPEDTYEFKVRDRVREILRRNDYDERKAAEVGLEIDRRFDVEGKILSGQKVKADEKVLVPGEGAVLI